MPQKMGSLYFRVMSKFESTIEIDGVASYPEERVGDRYTLSLLGDGRNSNELYRYFPVTMCVTRMACGSIVLTSPYYWKGLKDLALPPRPEQEAREEIDRPLTAAGWHVCDAKAAIIHAARGVAICERPLKLGHF